MDGCSETQSLVKKSEGQYRFFFPQQVSEIFLILTWEGPPSSVLHLRAFTWRTAPPLSPQGVFYPLDNLTDPPFPPVPFELPARSDYMLYIGISEYFFNSASFAHFAAGAFDVSLSTKEVRRVNRW